MPTAPGLVPTAAPSLSGTPEVNLPVPAEAFGGAVAHALEGLGGAVEGASDKVWARAMELQNLQNETTAKEADAKYMMESGKMHADFINKEGVNAGPQALADHIQALQDLRVRTREGLNPMAAKMYDASSLSFMGRNIFNAAGHSGQQVKVSANNADNARIQTMSDGIGENPQDDVQFQRSIRGIAAATEDLGQRTGLPPEAIEATKAANVSTAVAKRITGLARTNAVGAKSMFDSAVKSGALTPVDASKVEASVQTQFRQQGSRAISDKILGDRRNGEEDDKTEQEYIDAGQKEAEDTAKRLGIDDPLFKDFVRERISADYRRQKAVERDGEQAAEQTVASAMMTGNKEGILPKSVDELKLINPEVGAAWDRLRPMTQKKFMASFAHNASGDRVAWNNENLGEYQKLKGMAHDAPVEFLTHDVISDKLPASAKRELINLQQRLRNQSESDPRVGRAIQILGPELQSANIDKKSDLAGYRQFLGAMADQLDDFQKTNKRVPKPEEIQTIGRQLIQQQATGNSYFLGFGKEEQPVYKLPVPEEETARLRNDPYWKRVGVTPNDDMIARIYRAQKFKELYGGSAKKPAEAQFPPNE